MARPYAEVIGDPIAFSKSPLIHNFWLEKLGVDADYRATRVRPEELEAYLASRRSDKLWRGCNLTMPLKEKVLPLLDWVDDQTAGIGAANCVVSDRGVLGGANTDVWGLQWTLGLFEAQDPVIVIGTGGAARAALHHFQGINALEVHVVGRNRAKARKLLDRFNLYGEAWTFADEPKILLPMRLINASPLGMTGHPAMPEEGLALVDQLVDHARVLDMIYDPLETRLLARARERNLMAANGLAMLIDQARYAFELFFGQRPSSSLDEVLHAWLTS
ncbi:MAG: shikimate dehydrogenase family protein [Allosphingosinicella sp.]